jgi:hypothetical protein
MIKFLITGLNLIFFSWMAFFGEESPKVQQFIPLQLELNESSVVKVSIQKSKLSGFAKLEIDIPEGYAVSALDTKGASFTFTKGKMRFVWMNLPNNDKYDVSYRITHLEGVSNLESVKGVFSFIQDNKRSDVKIETQLKPSEQPLLDANGFGVTYLNSNQENPSCERKVSKSADGFTVELLIKLNGLKGFLKLQEWVSEGCSLTKSQNAAATVTVDGSKIKFVWFEVPDAPSMVVKYKVICPQLPESGLQIDGKMSFVFENNPREIPVTMMDNHSNQKKAEETANVTEVKDTSIEEKKEEIQVPVSDQKVIVVPESTSNVKEAEVKADVDQNRSTPEVKELSRTERQVNYKVQLMASHRKVSEEEWKTKYGFTDNYSVENHEGWMKWTHGDFNEYKTAKQYRNEVTQRCPLLPGPFVTAYQDGKRITVQEALMITQQPWVQ